MGLSLAMYGEITFKDGRVQQNNFDDYQVLRIDEAPRVTNVHIVPPATRHAAERRRRAGRAAVRAGAVNAIFAATGKRIRALPLGKQLEA